MVKKEAKKVKPKGTGSLTIDDYESLLPLVQKKQKEYKQFSAAWSKWGVINDKIKKKIDSMHKKEIDKLDSKSGPTTIKKEKARWWCFVCEKEHDKVKQKLLCPDCGSDNVVTMDKYLADKEKQREKEITV